MTEKHALLIGINKYPYMEPKYQLRGCINDAKLIRNTLTYKFNFKRSNIIELHDEDATRDGILAAMNKLLKRVKQNDVVLFHYSGHGHRCKSKTASTDEGSGKDNCLLPHDDSKPRPDGSVEYREIRDDVINDWLQKLVKKTSNITLIFDACHSGTMTRGVREEARARSVPETERPAPKKRFPFGKSSKRGAGGWLELNSNFVVISGCRDTQTSKERWFKEGDNLFRHGVLTYSLINALDRAKPGTTYRDVFESLANQVPANAADQNPQIEGRIDRVLFGVKDIEALRYLPVTAVSGKTVTLAGGAAHGLQKGVKWNLYPPHTKTIEGVPPVASATIDKVGATSSTATLSSRSPKIELASRAVPTQLPMKVAPLSVMVIGTDTRARDAMERAVKKSKLLKVVASKREADVEVCLISSGTPAARDLNKLVKNKSIDARTDYWACYTADGTLCFSPVSVSQRAVGNEITSNLETIARYRRILELENQASELKVEFNLYKRSATDKLTKVNGGRAEFKHGDAMVLEIINNEPDRALFFSLVWLSADKSVQQFYPPRKNSEEIAAGKTVRIGHGKRRLLANLGKNINGDFGLEVCKLMVTTEQSDFSWLNQSGTRSNAADKSSVAAFDVAVRGGDIKKSDKNKSDWSALNRSMIIRRK